MLRLASSYHRMFMRAILTELVIKIPDPL